MSLTQFTIYWVYVKKIWVLFPKNIFLKRDNELVTKFWLRTNFIIYQKKSKLIEIFWGINKESKTLIAVGIGPMVR